MVELNDGAPGLYNIDSQIKFKSSMLKSILCDYTYIFAEGTISIKAQAGDK